ncbi:BrnA antitoxin family protein [Falsiroseomonas sp. E2-1-a4]|uniref:BrnA antitoxin family protein n=1 Tax=Falsiroseomonas sp. E2-1-a4 TaxID=3239299 RepID=UPI003F3AFA37
MGKNADIRRYSADELRALRARGESRSDWARVDATSEAELEHAIAQDADWKDVPANWHEAARPASPVAKKLLSLRIDADIIEYFRSQGPGYQTWMNAVLRAYVTARGDDPKG